MESKWHHEMEPGLYLGYVEMGCMGAFNFNRVLCYFALESFFF